MSSNRNKPLAAQQPPPACANDPSGFWGAVFAANAVSGIGSLLPANTLIQSDIAIEARLLQAQIDWRPVQVRWKGIQFQASLSDAQFFLALEEGGDTQQGRITLIVNKLRFNGKPPSYGDTINLLAGSKWHEFTIAEMVGQHDDNEPALFLYLEKDQNAIGD